MNPDISRLRNENGGTHTPWVIKGGNGALQGMCQGILALNTAMMDKAFGAESGMSTMQQKPDFRRSFFNRPDICAHVSWQERAGAHDMTPPCICCWALPIDPQHGIESCHTLYG